MKGKKTSSSTREVVIKYITAFADSVPVSIKQYVIQIAPLIATIVELIEDAVPYINNAM